MKKYYKNLYGDTASISHARSKYYLQIWPYHAIKALAKKPFETERGAKIAMGKFSQCGTWKQVESNKPEVKCRPQLMLVK